MRGTRLVELTLYHAIRDCFARKKIEKPQNQDRRTYLFKHKNILPNFPVIIKKNGVVQATNTYVINYVEGIVVFNSTLLATDIVEAEYHYCTINLYDEGTNITGSDFIMPAVGIYENEREDLPFELGNSKKERNSYWTIPVWCSRGGERNDITDDIMELFEEGFFSITDYNIAFPLNEDGTKNTNFNPDLQVAGTMTVDSINCIKGGSLDLGDSKRFISEINIELTINI